MKKTVLALCLLLLGTWPALSRGDSDADFGRLIRVNLNRPPVTDIPLRLPTADRSAVVPLALADRRAAAESSGSAAAWRQYADAAVRAGHYPEAARAYRAEAAVYRRLGDVNAARAEELKALRWTSEVALYVHRAADSRKAGLARLEPAAGVLIGAFIDRDENLPIYPVDNQRHGDVRVFGRKTGKPHASYFMYRAYGQPFPERWVQYLKKNGAIPHIAWEPRRLSDVQDDAYLRGWMEAAKRANWPIMIRFAGEMNGAWTPYHGDPAAYRQAFQTVARVMRKAPRVAMMWCPNTVPATGFDAYYPGDACVDWVGVNMYNVLYLDNDRSRPADHVHPVDLLDAVYKKYSARKPIAIGEYAATHRAQIDGRLRTDFAVDKIAQLYASLPTRYPRVKMVNWYNCNNLVNARPGRQLNNYLLTDQSDILMAYAAAIDSPYFLGAEQVRARESSPVVVEPLKDGAHVSAEPVIEAWVRTYVARPRIYVRVDGKLVQATRDPFRTRIQLVGLTPGSHRIEVLAYDDRGRMVGKASAQVVR